MARFEPFRGTTYVAGQVVPDDVIAPPYDVVGPAEWAALAARSRYNAIEVELPLPNHEVGLDAYENAEAIFHHWHHEGVVAVDSEEAFYLYRMTFALEDGRRRSTTGVLGALGLDPDHRGDVLPHEETTPKDKHDRLSLLRAARTNFSPIWGLSVGEGLSAACATALASAGDAWRATDSEGVVHERWTVTDPLLLKTITETVAASPVLIADGHHRYDTACTYLLEQPAMEAAGAILAFVVELAEEELAVHSIHRLLHGIAPGALPGILRPYFEIEPGPDDPVELRNTMDIVGALGLMTEEGSWLLRPRPELVESVEEDLDSRRLAYVLEAVGIGDVHYQHGAVLAREAVDSGDAEAAVLLRPVSVSQIAATASGGRLMPPKSTFFNPKPRTGMVFRELDPHD